MGDPSPDKVLKIFQSVLNCWLSPRPEFWGLIEIASLLRLTRILNPFCPENRYTVITQIPNVPGIWMIVKMVAIFSYLEWSRPCEIRTVQHGGCWTGDLKIETSKNLKFGCPVFIWLQRSWLVEFWNTGHRVRAYALFAQKIVQFGFRAITWKPDHNVWYIGGSIHWNSEPIWNPNFLMFGFRMVR